MAECVFNAEFTHSFRAKSEQLLKAICKRRINYTQLLGRLSDKQWFKIMSRSLLTLSCHSFHLIRTASSLSFSELLLRHAPLCTWALPVPRLLQSIQACKWVNVCVTLSHPQLFTSAASLSQPSSSISSPLSEPRAKIKPQGDGETSLSEPTLAADDYPTGPIMSPHFGKQSKSNVCFADNVSNQNGAACVATMWENEREIKRARK